MRWHEDKYAQKRRLELKWMKSSFKHVLLEILPKIFYYFPRHKVEPNTKYTEALRGKWEKKTIMKTGEKSSNYPGRKEKKNNFFPLVSQKPSCNQINVQGKLVRVTIVWIFHHHSNTRFLSVSQHLSEDSEAHCVQSRCILILIYDWFVSLIHR